MVSEGDSHKVFDKKLCIKLLLIIQVLFNFGKAMNVADLQIIWYFSGDGIY